MPDFEQLYHIMFNAATDAVELIQQHRSAEAERLLIAAQQTAEEYYISSEETGSLH